MFANFSGKAGIERFTKICLQMSTTNVLRMATTHRNPACSADGISFDNLKIIIKMSLVDLDSYIAIYICVIYNTDI